MQSRRGDERLFFSAWNFFKAFDCMSEVKNLRLLNSLASQSGFETHLMYAPHTKRLELGSDTMALMLAGNKKGDLASRTEADKEKIVAKAAAVRHQGWETARTNQKKRPAADSERYVNAYEENQSITATYGGNANYQGFGDKGFDKSFLIPTTTSLSQ